LVIVQTPEGPVGKSQLLIGLGGRIVVTTRIPAYVRQAGADSRLKLRRHECSGCGEKWSVVGAVARSAIDGMADCAAARGPASRIEQAAVLKLVAALSSLCDAEGHLGSPNRFGGSL
jgi:hypothetical protein